MTTEHQNPPLPRLNAGDGTYRPARVYAQPDARASYAHEPCQHCPGNVTVVYLDGATLDDQYTERIRGVVSEHHSGRCPFSPESTERAVLAEGRPVAAQQPAADDAVERALARVEISVRDHRESAAQCEDRGDMDGYSASTDAADILERHLKDLRAALAARGVAAAPAVAEPVDHRSPVAHHRDRERLDWILRGKCVTDAAADAALEQVLAVLGGAVAAQQEMDFAMHEAFRPEVVAEVAVHLSEESDWDAIATWCGGTVRNTEALPSGEIESYIDIPGVRAAACTGMWIVQRHDLTFDVRAEVAGPTDWSAAALKAASANAALYQPAQGRDLVGHLRQGVGVVEHVECRCASCRGARGAGGGS